MKIKYIAVALATCMLAILLTLSIGATDVTTADTTAETLVETVAETTDETDAVTDASTDTAEEATSSEDTELSTDSVDEPSADKFGFSFRPDTLKKTLPIMGMGMLGIFLVTGTIILVITLLNWISNTAEKRKGDESDD